MMQDTVPSIPRRLNDPPRMFWWDLDLALLVFSLTLLGMIAGYFMTGAALGLLAAGVYSMAKSGKHPAYALHLIYWYLPERVVKLKRTPPSHLRELIG
jgi:conjugal transfer pilus assembly protein TraL